MNSPVNPRDLISQLEREGFYGQLELEFRHGVITYVRQTQTFVTHEYEPKNPKQETTLKKYASFNRD